MLVDHCRSVGVAESQIEVVTEEPDHFPFPRRREVLLDYALLLSSQLLMWLFQGLVVLSEVPLVGQEFIRLLRLG